MKQHIPAIDALRALAVVSVIVFHIDPAWLPGGFAGVDVFYVISGFVVTLSIARARTDFSVGNFFRRRIVRIFPAAIACISATLMVVVLLVPEVPSTKWFVPAGLAASWGGSNFVLSFSGGGYFEGATSFNPFTHTWSLAVEEQFYLLYPLLAFGLIFSGRFERRRAGVLILSVLVILSALLAAYLTPRSTNFAFYLLPTRFWEIGCGALLALWACRESRNRVGEKVLASASFASFASVCSLVGVVCLCALMAYSVEASFPAPGGYFVVAAACLTLASVSTGNAPALFNARPLVHLGKISYSLYLWHWPVIVFARWVTGLDGFVARSMVLVLTYIAALASYKFIEQPIQRLYATSTWFKTKVFFYMAWL